MRARITLSDGPLRGCSRSGPGHCADEDLRDWSRSPAYGLSTTRPEVHTGVSENSRVVCLSIAAEHVGCGQCFRSRARWLGAMGERAAAARAPEPTCDSAAFGQPWPMSMQCQAVGDISAGVRSHVCVWYEGKGENSCEWRQLEVFHPRRTAAVLAEKEPARATKNNAETALALALALSRSEPAQSRPRRRRPPDRRCKDAVTTAGHARWDASRDPGANR